MNWLEHVEGAQPNEGHQLHEAGRGEETAFSHVERTYLQQIEDLRPEVWAETPPLERLRSLQHLENRLADIEGRPAAEVQTSTHLAVGERGRYDRESGTILIPQAFLFSDKPLDAIEAVAVAGRHVYQEYAVHHPEIHSDPNEVSIWSKALSGLLTVVECGYELYRLQPLVADAFSFAGSVLDAIQGVTP